MFFIADAITGEWQQGGGRTKMCKFIMSDEWAADPLGALGAYAMNSGLSTDDYVDTFVQNTTINTASATRQWIYQTCTEFGWF